MEGSHLRALESESIHVIREVAAERERPVLLFSGGKDSLVLLRLCEKAFWPGRIPFPLLHVDTGHNFPEVLELRDLRARELSLDLVVASVEESIRRAVSTKSRDPMPPAIASRPSPYSTPCVSIGSTLRSVARDGTRSERAPRNGS